MTLWFIILAALVAVAALPFVMERRRTVIGRAERQGAPGRFAKLSQGVTRFEWHGPVRGPVIVAIHGLTTPPVVFNQLIPGLAGLGYRILTYDLYGRGLSDKPPGPQTAAYFRQQLTDVLEENGLQDDLTLLGYSMGAAIAVDFAAHAPERMKRVIAVAPAGIQLDENGFDAFCRRTPIVGDWLYGLLAARRMREEIAMEAAVHGANDVAKVLHEQLQRAGYLPSVLASRRGILAETQQDAHRLLGREAIPVVAFWGDADNVIPLSALGLSTQWNRAIRQEVIEGAGHGLVMTHHDALIARLRLILREKTL